MAFDVSPSGPPNAQLSILAGSGTRTSAVVDMSAYPWWTATWLSVGATSTSVNLQWSPDGTTWTTLGTNIDLWDGSSWTNRSQSNIGQSTTTGTILYGPTFMRYARLNTTATTTGTFTLQLVGAAVQPFISTINPPVSRGLSSGSDSVLDSSGDLIKNLSFTMGYIGGAFPAWTRVRVPSKLNSMDATASGNTALWTPASGRKFRLMRYKLSIGGNATIASAGNVYLTFFDGASTGIGVTEYLWLPSAAGSSINGWSSGWVDLGNGYLSTTANNVLNLNLNVALTGGRWSAIVCGTEE